MRIFYRQLDDNTNIVYRIGENRKENHPLIKDSDKNDWWFHLDNLPSCHCVVERNPIDEDDINFASKIVAENSNKSEWNNKNIKKIRVCYTQIKNLELTKNPGEVLLLKTPQIYILRK